MNRLRQIFAVNTARERKTLIAFASCGCPDLPASELAIGGMIEHGADIVELGVPFSDPTADGAVIQAASQRALAAGVKLADVLEMAGRLRRRYPEVGLVLFTYYNPVFNYGCAELAAAAARQGIDAVLCVDLAYEERDELKIHLDRQEIELIPLLTPATPPERAARISADAGAFVYYVTVRGVTGERGELPPELGGQLAAVRRLSPVPVAAGFGIGTPATARQVAACADGVVVGSAVVKIALSDLPPDEMAAATGELISALRAAI